MAGSAGEPGMERGPIHSPAGWTLSCGSRSGPYAPPRRRPRRVLLIAPVATAMPRVDAPTLCKTRVVVIAPPLASTARIWLPRIIRRNFPNLRYYDRGDRKGVIPHFGNKGNHRGRAEVCAVVGMASFPNPAHRTGHADFSAARQLAARLT